jgi:hypothetical protein
MAFRRAKKGSLYVEGMVKEIIRACPLTEVKAEYSDGRKTWHVVGIRNGEAVISIESAHLNLARDQFFKAYTRAVDAGILKMKGTQA